MPRQRKLVVVLLVFAILAAVGAVRAQDTVLADLEFRPETNGFTFPNYTTGNTDLTAVEMVRLFGPIVCEGGTADNDGNCSLVPSAQVWMDTMNDKMNHGHCEGMASLSLGFYAGQLDPTAFGADSIPDLQIDGNEGLQREIAYWWTTWSLSPTHDGVISGAPSEIVAALQKSFTDHGEAYTLDFWMPDWTKGHAITPYAVVDKGNGITWIMVYDNNWPDVERHVEVDLNNETWQYNASTDPNAQEWNYAGDATTQTMTLTPISPRLQQQVCPFCGDEGASAASGAVGISVNASNALIAVTDSQGNVTGIVNGKFVNNIPGATVIHFVGGDIAGDLPPTIYIPPKVGFKLSAWSLQNMPETERANFTITRNGEVTRVSNIKLDDQPDTLSMSDEGKFQYESGDGGETPTIQQGVTTSGDDYLYEIKASKAMSDDGTLNFSSDPTNGEFDVNGSDANQYSVNVDRTDNSGKSENFFTDNLDVPAGDSADLNAGQWQDGAEITGEIKDQQGNDVQAINLTDEPEPTENAPATEVAPSEEAPTEVAPSDEQPTEIAPTEEAPTQAAPDAQEPPTEQSSDQSSGDSGG